MRKREKVVGERSEPVRDINIAFNIYWPTFGYYQHSVKVNSRKKVFILKIIHIYRIENF